MSRRYIQPVRPVLNRRHPLAYGLVYACVPGWTKGAAVNITTRDDITKAPGAIQGSLGSQFSVQDFGRALSAGTSPDGTAWGDMASDQPVPNNGRYTLACLVRPKDLTGYGATGILIGRGNPSQANSFYFRYTAPSGPFALEQGDASGSDLLNDGLTATTVNESFLFVGTGAGQTTGALRIIRNGILSATQTPGSPDIPSARSVETTMLGDAVASRPFDGDVGMGAIWNRELTQNELKSLWVDPYVLWKEAAMDEDFFLGNLGTGLQTYFLSF